MPYFEITIQLNDTDYSAEYTPRHENEELPDGWVEGSDVPARIEKHALFLKRPDGSELRWSIVKRSAVKKSE